LGIVILSEHLLEKQWPQEEWNDLAGREVDGKKAILLVWHKVGLPQVFNLHFRFESDKLSL
jgi:hypothetical protein